MAKIEKINTEKLIHATNNNLPLPYFLNEENDLIFRENMKELYSFLYEEHPDCLTYEGQQISEETWNETKFVGTLFTALFSHWTKIIHEVNIFFVELLEDFPSELELEIEGEPFILFYKRSTNTLSKRDECIYEFDKETIHDFFNWLEIEIVNVGNIEELLKKYKAFTEVFVEEIDNLETDDDDVTTIELSDAFYDNVDDLKRSILMALEDNMEEDGISKENESKKQIKSFEPKEVSFVWNKEEISLNYPLQLVGNISDNISMVSFLDNKNGWLAQQPVTVQETLIGIWADFVYNKHESHAKNAPEENKTKIQLDWASFSEYFTDWLRFDSSSDVRKIDKKIRSTLEKVLSKGKIQSISYIDNVADFIKIVLYIEKEAAIYVNKNVIIDVENIQKHYFYALNNENTLLQVWNVIVQDKLKKSKVTKTYEFQFDALKEKFPNFQEVIDYYSGAMYIFEQTGTPPAPVLLLGSPGLGKTHFASEIAKIIGSMMQVIPVSSLSAGWIISGAASQWKDAQMGKIAQSLLNGTSMSPVIVLDEIDKKSEGNYDPLGALYPLLEYQTAKDFVDEFLEFPLNCSNVLWVATANNLNSIPEPILDRFVVFDIAKLNHEETIKVANNIFTELTHGLEHQELSVDILDILKEKTPRQIKQILKKALAYAAVKRTQQISLKKEHLDLKTKIKKIGF